MSYQYDALDRLTYGDGIVITYAYDAAGYRTQKVASPDTDGDGLLDLTDPDDDNDCVPDTEDAFPWDPAEWLDTDGDGIGNNADLDDDNLSTHALDLAGRSRRGPQGPQSSRST